MLNAGKIGAECIKLVASKGTNGIISRLAQKLRNQSDNLMVGYSRMHNRHNRS
ncbi:YhhA family cyclophane-containing RiPP [Buttiauxella sp. S04-F03]|uniref:YhhA family cyclophane-containing RiPP n=1 Tax=Buttiauxella sp. S04-F03 TaxID=2904525 RepID=UPI00351DA0F3